MPNKIINKVINKVINKLLNKINAFFLVLVLMTISLNSSPALPVKDKLFNLEGWQMTQTFPGDRVDIKNMLYPRFYAIFMSNWQAVTPDSSGRVDVSALRKPVNASPGVVMVRTIVYTTKKQKVKLVLNYSAETAFFLNGQRVFYGHTPASIPQPVELNLPKGRNEFFLALKQGESGWFFNCRSFHPFNYPVKDHRFLEPVWQTPKTFLTPESVLYDKQRSVLYVSNFDNRFNPKATREEEFTGFISILTVDGKVKVFKWAAPLHAPCGMTILGDRLFTVERRNLTAIAIDSGKIIKRYAIPNPGFPNDIAADVNGNIYITDTSPADHRASRIYKFDGQKVELWLDSEDIIRANGAFIYKGELLVGNSGDGFLKSVNLANKEISNVACLGAGVIDGIRADNHGHFLVSHWQGWVYRISKNGGIVEIMDTLPQKINSADFEFIKEQNLLVIPTFTDNRVMAYRLKD